jgi:hypothetical protein
MFKITLGALIGSIIAIALPSRVQRIYFAGAVFIVFAIIEIIFISGGGD